MARATSMIWKGLALAVAAAVAVSCGGGTDSGSPTANPSSSELLDRSYGYLIRGDADFARFAPNYANLRPFTRDTALVVESRSEREKAGSPASDYLEYFYVRVNRPMTVRMIVADSSGQGLISFEFPNLPNGEYTIGSKGWPKPQVDMVKGNPYVYVYFVGDQRFRSRYKLGLDAKYHLTYMPQPALPG